MPRTLAFALAGLAGFNAHGAGFLTAARQLGVKPDLVTASSGQIIVLGEWLRRGLAIGCKSSINPDAHATGEIETSTRWGVAIARKSGMPPERVVKAVGADDFACWLARRRHV